MEMQTKNATGFINGVPMVKENFAFPPFLFPIERNFDQVRILEWFKQNWHTSIYWCAIYLLAIYFGQKLMAGREPFKLRRALFIHNFGLAAFSTLGALRTLEDFFHVYKNFGLNFSLCDASAIAESSVAGFWISIFAFSKLVEFADTAFIVLRKQKLIFLHWYHHVTVCIYTWFALRDQFAPARWFLTINFTVHSVMYSYYALRAARVRVPKLVAMSITLLQIIQMFIGTFVILYAYLNIGNNCPHVQMPPIYLGLVMYGSYLALFCNFFVKVYMHGFAQAAAETAGKSRARVDENANTIEEKKKIH